MGNLSHKGKDFVWDEGIKIYVLADHNSIVKLRKICNALIFPINSTIYLIYVHDLGRIQVVIVSTFLRCGMIATKMQMSSISTIT